MAVASISRAGRAWVLPPSSRSGSRHTAERVPPPRSHSVPIGRQFLVQPQLHPARPWRTSGDRGSRECYQVAGSNAHLVTSVGNFDTVSGVPIVFLHGNE